MTTVVFGAQVMGFTPFSQFNLQMTTTQMKMATGNYLDPEFTEYFSKYRLPELFSSRDMEYIKASPQGQGDMSISNQTVDAAKVSRGAAINTAIAQASQQAGVVIDMAKSAFAIASRASHEQLQMASPMKRPVQGVFKQQFASLTVDKKAAVFLEKLGKFIEPTSLRQDLQTVSVIHPDGAMRTPEMSSLQQDLIQPGANLAIEAAMATGRDEANKIGFQDAQSRIKIGRVLPATVSVWRDNPISRITAQFKTANYFKSKIASGRFT